MTTIEPESMPGDGEETGDNGTPVPPAESQSRREAARAADATKIADLEKKNRDLVLGAAMREAGIDPKSAVGQLFARGYDGDMDFEPALEAAKGLGLNKTTEPVPEGPPLNEGEDQGTHDREVARSGAVADGETPSEDPRVTGIKEGLVVMESGTQEAGVGAFFDRVAHAAYAEGDNRAIWQPGKEDPRRGQDQGW